MANSRAFERIEAATRLEKPDQVPFVPIIDIFAAKYAGITQHEMMFDIDKADYSLLKTMNDLGWIDGFSLSYGGLGSLLEFIIPNPPMMPGLRGMPDDAEWMFMEKSVMEPSEYRDIAGHGALRWTVEKVLQTHPHLKSPSTFLREGSGVVRDIMKVGRSAKTWRRRGVEPLVAANLVFTPMEWMSMMLRGFNDFLFDMFRHPEEIKAASDAYKKTLWWIGMAGVLTSGVRRVFMGGARTSATVISPKQFEELALPEWLETSEYFVKRGITPMLHLDSDWTAFFPYLKELPRGKCILNLDGSSDIFKAKEILGDHICIMGDVPAPLLKLGEPDEVDEYCRRLIKEVGADGGFILSSGCTVPIDAKPENVKAMIASVNRYGKYK
ncbi:MAG TPA: uroporphyrinogen decarboxylase family protein [Candidatus Anoxymicrobiaceae bacterium]